MSTKLKDQSGTIEDIIDDLTDGGIKDLLSAIGGFIDPMIKLATGRIDVGGQLVEFNTDDMATAATNVAEAISNFLIQMQPMQDSLKSVDVELIKGAFGMWQGIIDYVIKANGKGDL